MALSLLVVSISFYLKEYISPDSNLYATLSLVSVAGVVVMVIAFSLGLGAMPWIIMSEILPINIKGLAGSFATLANWFFSWLVTLTANLLLDWSSGGTFTIYTAVCVFTAGFVAIWVPETKGKTLEEIQQKSKDDYNIVQNSRVMVEVESMWIVSTTGVKTDEFLTQDGKLFYKKIYL
ncbi:sugar transporter ERD6-like 6 [Lathyrus oleraceus]|uniref:sugar transporter ERD6-like 6 n=1 Tax=Pisum sativum TaxID=3888 RepID=UPI0021D3B747|nr:sugar transporter ERD6-like 6 [Pisum sativum]